MYSWIMSSAKRMTAITLVLSAFAAFAFAQEDPTQFADAGAYIGIRVNQSHCYRCGFNLVRRCSKDGLEGFRSWVTGRDLCDQHKPYAGRGQMHFASTAPTKERTPISISVVAIERIAKASGISQ
ncbi:MAG: hypothetical protein IPI76_13235 [Chloracidobacterium sp.]|nr:hypothetical protein [Chloracidobacterium sp.]